MQAQTARGNEKILVKVEEMGVSMRTELIRDNKKILEQVEEIGKKIDRDGGVSNRVEFDGPCLVPDPPEITPGLDAPLKELRTELVKDEGMQVIVVSALGGAGKTTLVKKLCADNEIKDKFQENIFFVTVSKTPDVKLIVQRIFQHMKREVPTFQTDEAAINDLERLLKSFGQKATLLVLDDVWSESLVQKFKLNLLNYRILVTSRSVFPHFGSGHKLKPLDDEAAMILFRSSVTPQDGEPYFFDENLANKILRVCKGSPLALTVVGRLLCGKPAAVWQSTVKEWDRGSFPQDQRIPITALIDMWMELHEWVEDGLSAITYLHKLSDRCLVNLVIATTLFFFFFFADETFSSRWYELKAPEVKVVVLNLRTNKYTLPNFMGNMGKLKVVIVSNYGFLPTELNNFSLLGSDTVSNLKRIRLEHISIPSFGVQMNNLQKISLVMCNVGQAYRNSNFQISEAFPNLLEFEIDDCNDLEKLPDGLCDIVSLKKVNIINCHKLSALPEEIGKLVKLEELRLVSCTELSELPEMVAELSNLKLLDISGCLSITKLSTQVGKLRNLETLCMRGCSSCRLPASIMKLERLNVVKCDEVTASQWETYKHYLPKLKVEVLKDDINLNWLRKRHF
ncbi:hypothetical protein EZV62_014068 [Acer yangbiense]|uniref:NB-ARC domain-containing protein n=1 Tax=Acer yangbiense TaxID=1000413 RepID=A0A5C7HRQ2_9ROSI|nr:hypothetical protein EZV62_014068 [Acer yangbiense]